MLSDQITRNKKPAVRGFRQRGERGEERMMGLEPTTFCMATDDKERQGPPNTLGSVGGGGDSRPEATATEVRPTEG
jgi:hypothetical protein